MHGKCYIITTLFCFISIQATGAEWFYRTSCDNNVTYTSCASVNTVTSKADVNNNSEIFPSSSDTIRTAFYALHIYHQNLINKTPCSPNTGRNK